MTAATSWNRIGLTEVVLGTLLVVILPLLNTLGWLSDYTLNLIAKYLALAILALGMDLIWGYTGILSLGQAVFFGLGAYAMGMYLMLGSSGQGVYGEPIPDFMVWNRVMELPLFWKPFQKRVGGFGHFVRRGRVLEIPGHQERPHRHDDQSR